MSDRRNAVIDGTYSDFKLVKTRSVFQMVIEGPIERAAEAIAMFGVPQPGQEIPVAVARLQPPEEAPREPVKNDAARERGRERYLLADDGEKAVVRAGLLPKDKRFQRWTLSDNETEAAQFIRDTCDITSRSQIASNERAYNAFRDIEFQFHGHAEIRS